MKKENTCCVTGHRPEKLAWGNQEDDPYCAELKNRLRLEVERAYQEGFRHFISGMARGVDQYFAQIVLDLKKQWPDVTLEAAIPCEEQSERWSQADQKRYREILAQCDLETMVQHHFDKTCMLRRNRYMVDRSARLIAVYNGTNGGTMYTIHHALKNQVDVVILEPPKVLNQPEL